MILTNLIDYEILPHSALVPYHRRQHFQVVLLAVGHIRCFVGNFSFSPAFEILVKWNCPLHAEGFGVKRITDKWRDQNYSWYSSHERIPHGRVEKKKVPSAEVVSLSRNRMPSTHRREDDLREAILVPNDKFLKSILSFGHPLLVSFTRQ